MLVRFGVALVAFKILFVFDVFRGILKGR
jgi:hypothetical protein